MSEGTIKRLMALLAVAVALYAGLAITTRLGRGGGSTESGVANALARVSVDEVRVVRVAGSSDTIRLERTDDAWTVNGYAADVDAVDRLLRAIEDTEVGAVTATNPDNHERMGVAGPDARTLGIEFGGGSVTLLVGNAGSRFGTSYARLPDDDAVVVLQGELRSVALRGLEQWRDKMVLRVDTAAVAALVVSSETGPYRLERVERGWTLDGAPADSTVVAQMLGELGNLDATGFAPDSASVGGNAAETLTLLDEAGTTLAELRLLRVDQTLWMQRAGDPTVFTLPEWRADRVRPSRETLRPGPVSDD